MISFGDTVRIRETPETRAAGLAGLTGSIFGDTVPSANIVPVIGTPREDFAFGVHFDSLGETYWLAEELLEFVDGNAGMEISLEGVDKKWVKAESGEWVEKPPPQGPLHKLRQFFRHNK